MLKSTTIAETTTLSTNKLVTYTETQYLFKTLMETLNYFSDVKIEANAILN